MAPTPLSLLRIIKDFTADCLPSVLPVSLADFFLDRLAQIPEIPVMVAKNIMRQFVAERISNDFVISISIIRICPEPQLYDLASISVQPQGARLVGRVLGWVHLRQHADAEFVFAHGGLDAGVVAQALEKLLRARRAGEVAEREDGLEGVGGLLLGFLPVAVAIGGCGFESRGGRPRGRAWGREGGEFGGGRSEKEYFLRFEGAEQEDV